jgi:hypothetical protein
LNISTVFEKNMNTPNENEVREQINAVIERLKLVYGADTDLDLSRKMNFSHGTVNVWRARGLMPYKQCFQASMERNVSIDWLVSGKGGAVLPPPKKDDEVVGLLQIVFKRLVSVEGKLDNLAEKCT